MFILFDIGGTNTRIAGSKNGKSFSKPIIYKTPKTFTKGIKEFVTTSKKIASGKKIEAVAGGIAGPLNKEKSKMVNSPNIPGWIGKPLVAKLRERFRAPIFLENDTAVVGLGEAQYGAGKKYAIVAYITISTGVNGVRIVNKKIDVSRYGFEIGHQIISADDAVYYNHSDTFGKKVSGKAVQHMYKRNPWDIEDPKIWDRVALWTARGLVNTALYWSPDAIVLGGSMMKKKGIPLERIIYYYKKLLYIFPEKPRVVKATLGDIGGLYGALSLLQTIKK